MIWRYERDISTTAYESSRPGTVTTKGLGVPQGAEWLSRSSERRQCIALLLNRTAAEGQRLGGNKDRERFGGFLQTASLKAVAFLPLLPYRHSGLKNRQTPVASIDSKSSMNSISRRKFGQCAVSVSIR